MFALNKEQSDKFNPQGELAKKIADELSITAFACKDVIAANFMLLLAHLTRTTSNSVHLSLAQKEAISK